MSDFNVTAELQLKRKPLFKPLLFILLSKQGVEKL